MTTNARIRIVLADDHPLVREGIRQALAEQPDMTVVAEAASGTDTIQVITEIKPDVLVLDISMPEGSGLDVLPKVRKAVPAMRVLMLSVHDDPEYVLEAVRAGAHGYLRKDTLPSALRDAVRRLHAGETCFDLPPSRTVDSPTLPEASERLARLTRRERDVLLGIVSGESNKEIAHRLELSTRTVESYRESMMRKVDLRSVAELTRLALQAGLAPPDTADASP